MSEARWSLFGLAGFVLSGILFVISGVRAGDPLTIAGSLVWIVACAIWARPLVAQLRDDGPSS